MRMSRVKHWAPLLVLLVVGCGREDIYAMQAEISGKVLYQGRPVPGGCVTFLSDRGVPVYATLDADGSYHVRAPLGELKVSVYNRTLLIDPRSARNRASRPPEGDVPVQTPTGTYVPIPEKYSAVETSGLTYHAERGRQTFDIQLE